MKLKKTICILISAVMVLSALPFTAGAAINSIAVNYDIVNYSKNSGLTVVDHAREYEEYTTGDDVSSLGAYTAHNIVFDGGKNDGTMTYLSPNPYGYWKGQTGNKKALCFDYGGAGSNITSEHDISYIAYKISASEGNVVDALSLKVYGVTCPSLNQAKNGGWAQMAVYVFMGSLPTDANGKIDFSQYGYVGFMGDMSGVWDFQKIPQAFDLSEQTFLSGQSQDAYIVIAMLCSGGILEPGNKMSGFGGDAPILRLKGVDIRATQRKPSDPPSFQYSGEDEQNNNKIYVSRDGSDANDGYKKAVSTVAKGISIAAEANPKAPEMVIENSYYTLTHAWEFGTAKDAGENQTVAEDLPGIVFWGDSLTAGTATYDSNGKSAYNPIPEVIGRLVESNLIKGFNTSSKRVNFGVGGENAATIVGRSNAIPAVLTSDMAVPTVGVSDISMGLQGYPDSFTPLLQSTGYYDNVQNVTIGSINGTLFRDPISGKYQFARMLEGSATVIPAGTPIIFTSGNNYAYENYIPVIFMGYNDGADIDISKLTAFIDAIIAKYPQSRENGKYIVICPHFAMDKVSETKKVEASLEAKYGSHLIKTREFLSTMGMFEMGMSPSSADYARMSNGQIPAALMSTDETHYSYAGYELVGKLIYQKMHDLGYFDRIISSLGITEMTKTLGVEKAIPSSGTHSGVSAGTVTDLKINVNYDCSDYGGRGLESCVNDSYSMLNNINAELIGAVSAHNVFVDGAARGGMMTYIHPGMYNDYIDESDVHFPFCAYEADFLDLSTIDDTYDFSYISYKVSAGEGNHIDSLNVNLYGALWPSVTDYPNVRYQMAVYLMNERPTGKVDFSKWSKTCVFAFGDETQYPDAYSEDTCYKINCENGLKNLGKSEDVYITVVLFCGGFGIGESIERHSRRDTTTSLRFTGINITATAADSNGDPIEEHHEGTPDGKRLPGDVTGDGYVNSRDLSRIYAHVNKTDLITDPVAFAAADVCTDGVINSRDLSRIYAHVNKTDLLF